MSPRRVPRRMSRSQVPTIWHASTVAPKVSSLLRPYASADVVVCQWEIPLGCVVAAFTIAREAGVTTIFNPAPAQPELPAALLERLPKLKLLDIKGNKITDAAIARLKQALPALEIIR